MDVVVHATLAGGVAIGSSADLIVNASFAVIVGGLTGIISAVGFMHLGPFL